MLLLFHIIDKFSDETEFVIAVGYLKETVKQYINLAYPNGKFEFVEIENYDGEGAGRHSLLKCHKSLQCPFIFSCDTVIEEEVPLYSHNWIGVAKNNDPKAYCTVRSNEKVVTELIDKSFRVLLAFIGVACIYNYKCFLVP